MDVLLLGEDHLSLGLLSAVIREDGYVVGTAPSLAEGRQLLAVEGPGIAIADLAGELGSRVAAITELVQSFPRVSFGLTVHEDAKTLLAAFGGRVPSITFFRKPFNLGPLVSKIHDLYEARQIEDGQLDAAYVQQSLFFMGAGLVAQSQHRQEVARAVIEAGRGDYPVFIHGPPGTDKQGVARAIHEYGARAEAQFVAFDCGRGGLAGLLQLLQRRVAPSTSAKYGMLFIETVENLPDEGQAALLDWLTAHPEPGTACPRIVTASTLAPRALAGRALLPALMAQLTVFCLPLKPLRDHPEDILPLAVLGLTEGGDAALPRPEIDAVAARMIRTCDWPGNEAELAAAMKSVLPAARAAGGVLTFQLLKPVLPPGAEPDHVGERVLTGARFRLKGPVK